MTEEHMQETYELYIKAFTEPSLSLYYGIYIQLIMALAVFGAGIWYFFGGRKEPNVMVSMDEIDDGKPIKKKSNKKPNKNKDSSKRSDTKDTTNTAADSTNEYRKMSLKREMDRKGPYLLTED